LARNTFDRVILTLPDGRKIFVTVAEVSSAAGRGMGRVKLGFDAPADVAIHRDDAGKRTA
jgi:sRNA-binding carbon storage regulator CsrA